MWKNEEGRKANKKKRIKRGNRLKIRKKLKEKCEERIIK